MARHAQLYRVTRTAIIPEISPLPIPVAGHYYGPGQRSVLTMHRQIEADQIKRAIRAKLRRRRG